MSKASGILLIAVGIGAAVYAMPSHNDDGDQQPAPELAVARVAPAEVASTFTATTPAVTTPKAALPEIVPPIPKPAVRPVKDAAPAEPKSPVIAPAKPVVVATSPRTYERPTPIESKSAPAIVPGDRFALTRELQRELRRVGCYDGEINGTWTPSSRRAMKVFTDRVNASLPIEQPDYILLKLVQGSPERICGAGCPAGQAMSGDGRCLPNAVIAHSARKTNPVLPATSSSAHVEKPAATTTSGWSTTTTVATRDLPVPPEGRMALSGPGNETAPVRRPPIAGEERSALGAVTQIPDETLERAERPLAKGATQRKPRLATVENPNRRYEPAPRKKFGPWFFRQQDALRN